MLRADAPPATLPWEEDGRGWWQIQAGLPAAHGTPRGPPHPGPPGTTPVFSRLRSCHRILGSLFGSPLF